MKKSEMRQLLAEYERLKSQTKKNSSQKSRILERMQEIEHRYYHETGSKLNE